MASSAVRIDHPDRDVRHAVAVHVDEVVPDVHHLARVWVRLAVRGHVIEPVILRRQRPAKVAQAERFQIRAEFELVRAAGLVRRQQTAGVVLDAVVGGVFGLDHPERRVRVAPFRKLREEPRDEDAPNRIDVSEARVQRFPALFLLREPPGANVPSPVRSRPVRARVVVARIIQAYPVDHAVAVEPVVPPRAEHRLVCRVRAVAEVDAVQPRGQDAVDDEVVERAFAHDGREVAPERGVVAFGRPRGRRGELSIELFLSSR